MPCIQHGQDQNALFYAGDQLMRCTEEQVAGQSPEQKGHTPGNANASGH